MTMSSLDQSKDRCAAFIRLNLPKIRKLYAQLPTLPRFNAEPGSKPHSHRFIEHQGPNWWQLPKEFGQAIFNSAEAKSLVTLLNSTSPFSHVLGKQIAILELGRSSNYGSGSDIAREIFVSYLFAAGADRWKPRVFDRVWSDCVAYFDPSKDRLACILYAPIAYMPGVARQLDLEDGLSIVRIPAKKRAHLATLNNALAGVNVSDLVVQWPTHFFTYPLNIEKRIVDKGSHDWILQSQNLHIKLVSCLNEEVAMLRSLLNETPAVPAYAIVHDSYHRIAQEGWSRVLPWQARLPRWIAPPARQQVNRYRIMRKKFLNLRRESGWESVAASMRRFAVAWENKFRVDILADLVAALEHLVVRSDREVSYKLRVRSSHFLRKSGHDKRVISSDLRDAYSYRSRVFHGGYVFDDAAEWETAQRLKRPKKKLGKGGNPFHDVNEVHRLIYRVSDYYRGILKVMIDRGVMEVNWSMYGL